MALGDAPQNHYVVAVTDESLLLATLFARCSPAELSFIRQFAQEAHLPQGTVLTEEGQAERRAYVLLAGDVSARCGNRFVGRYQVGDLVGDLPLLGGSRSLETAVADSDLDVVVIEARDFAHVLLAIPSVAVALLRDLARRLDRAERALAGAVMPDFTEAGWGGNKPGAEGHA